MSSASPVQLFVGVRMSDPTPFLQISPRRKPVDAWSQPTMMEPSWVTALARPAVANELIFGSATLPPAPVHLNPRIVEELHARLPYDRPTTVLPTPEMPYAEP